MLAVGIIKNRNGGILPLTAIVLIVLIGMAALSIDVGQMYIARQRAQNVCDASALAGIRNLDPGKTAETQATAEQSAKECAAGNNELRKWIAYVPGTDTEGVQVTFPDSTTIRVDADVKVNYAFAGIFGDKTTRIKAHAIASLSQVENMSYPLVPLAVTDTTVQSLQFGQQQSLKTFMWQQGEDAFLGPGNFSPVRFDGDNGANDFSSRLAGTNTDPVEISIGDYIDTEPGNMVMPSYNGAMDRINSDSITWDQWAKSWDPVNQTFIETDRLIILPVIGDPSGSINGCSEQVQVVGFVGFFIESALKRSESDGKDGTQITGMFVTLALGSDAMRPLWWMGTSNTTNYIYKPRLIE